jgi:hypothetical protein
MIANAARTSGPEYHHSRAKRLLIEVTPKILLQGIYEDLVLGRGIRK